MRDITTSEVMKSLINVTLGSQPDTSDGQSISEARSVFLKILAPADAARYLTKANILQITPVAETSKKDAISRGHELAESINESLTTACKGRVSELLVHQRASDLLVELLRSSNSHDLLMEVLECTTCEMLEDVVAHRALKRIISNDAASKNDSNQDFVNGIVKTVNENILQVININRGCFVLAALLEHPIAKKPLGALLSKHKTTLRKIESAGAKVLVKMLN